MSGTIRRRQEIRFDRLIYIVRVLLEIGDLSLRRCRELASLRPKISRITFVEIIVDGQSRFLSSCRLVVVVGIEKTFCFHQIAVGRSRRRLNARKFCSAGDLLDQRIDARRGHDLLNHFAVRQTQRANLHDLQEEFRIDLIALLDTVSPVHVLQDQRGVLLLQVFDPGQVSDVQSVGREENHGYQ